MSIRSREMLEPFVPSADDPFDLAKAGHLLRRSGFGGSLGARRALVRGGVESAVGSVCTAGSGEDVDRAFDDAQALGSREAVRAYRVWRMLAGNHRLAERMSLFWHGHFATSDHKVRNPRMMGRQLALFDRLGLGRFDALLLEVSRDPAMIRWLDNDTNVRGRPNENYARELFELFTLGEGQYRESDVKAAARAFTGWHLRGERFAFRRAYHDPGEKTLFGQTGRFTGEEVLARTVERPDSARFLARKLLQFFVHPEPVRDEVAALAAVYQGQGRRIGATLRILLGSRLFFSSRAYRSMVKSPADFVVGTVRNLGVRAAPIPLAERMAAMGQDILSPPNVAGWPGGRQWITSATWLLRSNFCAELFTDACKARPAAAEILDARTPAARANQAIEILLDGQVDPAGRKALEALAAAGANATDLLQAAQCLPEGQML